MSSKLSIGIKSQRSYNHAEASDASSDNELWTRHDSGTPDLLRTTNHVRHKFSKLDEARRITDEKIRKLIQVTNDYTELLQRRPAVEDVVDSDTDQNEQITDNLLNDPKIRSIYDRLQMHIQQLEGPDQRNVINRSSSSNSLNHSNTYHGFVNDILDIGRPIQSDFNDTNQGRLAMELGHNNQPQSPPQAPALNGADQNRVSIAMGRHKHRPRPPSVQSLGRNTSVPMDPVMIEPRNTGHSIASQSSGSSRRPLNQIQTLKLQAFQNALRDAISKNQSKFQTSRIHERMPSSADNRNARRPSLPVQGYYGTKQPVISGPGHAIQANFGKPRKGGSPMLSRAVKTVNHNHIKPRPSSAPSSPRRHLEKKPLPFVSGKSPGPSHSVLVNLQQLLALLKVQNPHLYLACQNLDDRDTSLTSLADVFVRELRRLLEKMKDELKELLIDYDTMSTAVKSESTSAEDRVDLTKRLAKMARQMEIKDTHIDRLQKQLHTLIKLKEEAISLDQHYHPCKHIPAVAAWQNQQNYNRPTTSTILKSTAGKRSKSLSRVHEHLLALRDVKSITNVMIR